MRSFLAVFFALICLVIGESPFKLLFASCQHQDLREYAAKIWSHMELENANELLLLGDAIYGDHRIFLGWSKPTSVAEMTRRYAMIQNDPRWQRLIASVKRGRAIGTWDDHDYGVNGGDYKLKEKVSFKKLFLDFLGEPAGSKVRQQEGLFQSYDFLEGRVLLIVLDLRYFACRDAGILLGNAQWDFVEQVRSPSG
jgi:alkaline phosphatase D